MLLLIFLRGTNTHSTKPLCLISLGRSHLTAVFEEWKKRESMENKEYVYLHS